MILINPISYQQSLGLGKLLVMNLVRSNGFSNLQRYAA